MTLYRYKAAGKDGSIHKGNIEASSIIDLRNRLTSMDLSLIFASKCLGFSYKPKLKLQVLLEIFNHLEQFERAGISLKESLIELQKSHGRPKLKKYLFQILEDINGGHLLSKALSNYPHIFDSILVSLVKAGEKTGDISKAYHEVVEYLQWIDNLQSQTLKALRYPLMIALVLGGVMVMLVTLLVPELVSCFQVSVTSLPLSTRILLLCSTFLSDHLLGLVLCFIGLFIVVSGIFRFYPKGFHWKDWILMQIPLVGPIRKTLFLSRFFHIFSTLFKEKIEIREALEITCHSLSLSHKAPAIKKIVQHIHEGLSLSKAFEKVQTFPSIVIRMIHIGEKTSSLDKTLFHLKAHFDSRLQKQVERLVSSIEPIMLCILGLILMWIVCAIFLPLYDSFSTLDP